MRTDNQRQASKLNGARSNGPLTTSGKAKSARNAGKHGLSGGHLVLLCNEDQELYREIADSFYARFEPADNVEADLVQQLISASWRIRRITGIEAAMLDLEMARQHSAVEQEYEHIDETCRVALAFTTIAESSPSMSLLHRYETRARRAYDSALRNLLELQRERRDRQPAAAPPPAPEAENPSDETVPNEPEPKPQTPAAPPEPVTVAFLRRPAVSGTFTAHVPNEPGAPAFAAARAA